jgi:hypothetical protein
VFNWNKGTSSSTRFKDDYLYSKYYKPFPLDHTRFELIAEDLNGLSKNYKDSVCKLFDYGLITGSFDDNRDVYYYPATNLTRAEVATIINRIIDKSTRRIIDEIFLKRQDEYTYSILDEAMLQGAIIRSNQYKGIIIADEVINSNNKDHAGYVTTYSATRGFGFDFQFQYPEVVFDNYLPQRVMTGSKSYFSSNDFFLKYVPAKYREQFKKDVQKCYDALNSGSFKAFHKTYGPCKVELTKINGNEILAYIYPFKESFECKMDYELYYTKKEIEDNNMRYIDEMLTGDGVWPYIRALTKAIYENTGISLEELLKIVEPAWERGAN